MGLSFCCEQPSGYVKTEIEGSQVGARLGFAVAVTGDGTTLVVGTVNRCKCHFRELRLGNHNSLIWVIHAPENHNEHPDSPIPPVKSIERNETDNLTRNNDRERVSGVCWDAQIIQMWFPQIAQSSPYLMVFPHRVNHHQDIFENHLYL